MYNKYLLSLVVLHIVRVSTRTCDCNYNLSEVFRTPKDFSRVNFDHLEILERNNFDNSDSDTLSASVANNDIDRPGAILPKSIANAQVMLKFGSDDMQGRNRIDKEKPEAHPHPHRVVHYYQANDHRYPPYVPYLPPREEYHSPHVPMPRPQVLSYPPHPMHPSSSQYYYPYPPPPPFSFPNYYYTYPEYRPQPHSHYPHVDRPIYESYNDRFKPVEEDLDSQSDSVSINSSEEKDFLEYRREKGPVPEIINQDHPQILEPMDLSNDTVPETVCPKFIKNATEENTQSESIPKSINLNPESVEVVEHVAPLIDVVEEIHAPLENIVEEQSSNDNGNNVELVENTALPSTTTERVEIEIPTGNADWLNSSLVEYTCPTCGQRPKLLVSYPTTNRNEADPIVDRMVQFDCCPCMKKYGSCNCDSCHRNPMIPYGKRFATDIDSLLNVKLPNPISVAPLVKYHSEPYSTGYSASASSSITTGYSQVGNQKPKIFLDGHSLSSGSGYYADPRRAVTYRHPTIVDVITAPEPPKRFIDMPPRVQYVRYPEPLRILPQRPPVFVEYVSQELPKKIQERPTFGQFIRSPEFPRPARNPKMQDPHLYKVLPKYDIVPVNVRPLNLPDLKPTNHFVCHMCNQAHSPNMMCHREFIPKFDDLSYTQRDIPVNTIVEPKPVFLSGGPPAQSRISQPLPVSVSHPVEVVRDMGPIISFSTTTGERRPLK